MSIPLILLDRQQRIRKRQIAAILASTDLDFHDPNGIVNILNHSASLLCIDSMTLIIMELGLQDVEFPPGLGLEQVAVMRYQIRAIGTDSPVVWADTGTSTTKSEDGGSNHAT